VTKGNGVRDCQLGTVRFRSTTYGQTQPEAYLRSYSLKDGFHIYLQFNKTTTVYLQCSRLPMLLAHNHAARSLCCTGLQPPFNAAARLPFNAAAYNHAACSLCCTGLQHRLPSMQRLTTTQHAPFAATANRGTTALQTALPRAPFAATANRELPAVCARRKSCLPFLPPAVLVRRISRKRALPADRPRLIYSCSLATPLLPAHWPSPADHRPATPSQCCCCPAHPTSAAVHL
jgi:hypothetical protein